MNSGFRSCHHTIVLFRFALEQTKEQQMLRTSLSLQPSEAAVAQSACNIYAAYIAAGRVEDGKESEWMKRSLDEALSIAKQADKLIQSDHEMG